ncbi:MAG: hypothetical protein LBH43_00720 [Treponema sp.]|nr:hypothetical protein [Treponema sp.]
MILKHPGKLYTENFLSETSTKTGEGFFPPSEGQVEIYNAKKMVFMTPPSLDKDGKPLPP